MIITLVGNKKDSEQRQVSITEATDFAKNHGIKYFEASAKYKENVDEVFEQLFKQLIISKSWKIYCSY